MKGTLILLTLVFSLSAFAAPPKSAKSKFYDLVIGINTKKTISLRDSSGDPKIFLMSIDVNVNVQENNNSIGNKNFSEDFSYNNMENKFDLSKYEKNIENNIIDKITERIVTYLHSI